MPRVKKPQPVKRKMLEDDELMSTRDVARLVSLSEAWFEKARCQRRGPPYIKIGRTVRYVKRELLEWFSEQGVR